MKSSVDKYSGGSLDDYFRDCGKLQKNAQRKPYHRRVCWRHGGRAPNSTGSLCGQADMDRAPSFSPEAF